VFPGGSSSGSSGGSWWGLRQRFLNLFGRAGGATESKDELSSALMDLSEDLMAQVSLKMGVRGLSFGAQVWQKGFTLLLQGQSPLLTQGRFLLPWCVLIQPFLLLRGKVSHYCSGDRP
jgi:hypothetical protein